MDKEPSESRQIPTTALRHFYWLLRRFQSQAFHMQAAKECLRRPDQLDELVAESVSHFATYDNRSEGFHSRKERSLSPARLASAVAANRLVQNLSSSGGTVVGHPYLDFDFVDHEISPLRTTRSTFDTGAAGRRGGGGVDLLLANRADRLPIVADIKADTDRNPFLGLIQCLTYAVELSTEPQRARLSEFYPNRFDWPATGPWIDIYLLLIQYPDDDDSREFLRLTRQIADAILSPSHVAAQVVRRIAALSSTTTSNECAVGFLTSSC